ncbi:Suppressor of cytokine signaling 2 [Bagarius yarrelli]|uniref:Suppressor of cytokine signaling 2 n=1 Tax=Bagarius yarrelli TaxID=175774 RepID=A0A556V7E6_BAGYA|nr:Suppressor of cytokine signaling 2 [Bagarius yarrelli]
MGHTQCISKSADCQALAVQRGSFRLHELCAEPPGTPAITPDLIPKKPASVTRVKERRLEPNRADSSEEAQRLQNAMTHLHNSGWYWGSITAAEAKQLLNEALDGSFLVRDSSNPGYLLTLSVKTELGPTHLRIEYTNGHFGFDSVVMARPHLRQFKGAVDLVQYYTLAYRRQATHRELGSDPDTPTTATAENTLQLKLTKPLHKAAPSLQQLCRVVINQHSHDHRNLPLPERLKDFLREYPFVL